MVDKELDFQKKESTKLAAELAICNKKLDFQKKESAKRADELAIANKELAFQNEEKDKRADELAIANKELAFQNEEKAKRADELVIANKELAFQNEEKDKRADELVIANKEMVFQKNLAGHDALTGLINRRSLEDRIDQAIKLSKRNKSPAAVFFIDIDDFKKINDDYGHAIGDLLLQNLAKRIQAQIRQVDTLARIGGDEFVLLLPDIKNEDNAIQLAQLIIHLMAEGFSIEGKKHMITLSIGISLYPREDSKSLLTSADSAMYYVKKHGKNNFKLSVFG
ncbi:MAG: diguanylate cyclase [Legionellaceae bacterium]|nr:diguanylate cyclase [Legionellaceae bacterium]